MRLKELILLLIFSIAVLFLTMTGESGSTLAVPPWIHYSGMHRATQFHLDIHSGYGERFDDPQGIFCVKMDCRDDSATRDDDDELSVFGLNRGSGTLIYNKDGSSIGIAGGRNGIDFSMDNPRDICGDRKGDLFIADTGNDRVVRLRYEDDEVRYVGEMRSIGDYSLSEPMGVDACDGLLYVADTGNDRIIVARFDGTPVKVIGPEISGTRMCRPSSLRLVFKEDEWLYYSDYFIAVIDSFGRRLWKIGENDAKTVVARYDAIGSRGYFDHLDCDYYGSFYVTDPENDVIHKYDRNLRYITAIGQDRGGLSFDEPRGISIFRRFGQLFVTERRGARYLWVGTDIRDLEASDLLIESGEGKCRVQVSFLLTEYSILDVCLEDEDGKTVLYFMKDYLLPEGRFHKILETRLPERELLANCKFTLVVLAKPTYSSGEFLMISKKSDPLTPSKR